MIENNHRKYNVRRIIRSLGRGRPGWVTLVEKEFITLERNLHQNDHFNTCVATGLMFLGKMSEMVVTWSNYGPIWTGLWLDCKLRLDDEHVGGHGNTLFPRWLAEVLNEECDLKIVSEDIYDD